MIASAGKPVRYQGSLAIVERVYSNLWCRIVVKRSDKPSDSLYVEVPVSDITER